MLESLLNIGFLKFLCIYFVEKLVLINVLNYICQQ